MSYSANILEEELKNKVAQDYFHGFDSTKIIGKIDFCIAKGEVSFLWAEAKAGVSKDIYESFVQLILTIGKAKTFENFLPPSFLGAFDAEKIAFLPYHYTIEIFNQNDFNWNVAPSNHATKEFKQLYSMISESIERESLLFSYDDPRLREFIQRNFKTGLNDYSRMEITKNNFISVYYHWVDEVKPSILLNWDKVKSTGLLDSDFYLADLISQDDMTLKEKLFVLLKKDNYEFGHNLDKITGIISLYRVNFRDGQKAYKKFWNYYVRPPKGKNLDYIIAHRDLLVPQDIRERKGSYFTPRQWVKLSQKYLTDVLGKNWQNEYYVWDCAAGTGNLLAGLTNKYNIWASTIDPADIGVMKDSIEHGANLIESHVFQFDFLNDDFSKLPKELKNIIDDPETRKKLVLYINPPYAEVSTKIMKKNAKGKRFVNLSMVHTKYKDILGTGGRELFVQFLMRIYKEIPDCTVGIFSKLKLIQGPSCNKFMNDFVCSLERLFVIPANTFDNVTSSFAIGFHIWNLSKKEPFSQIEADVYDSTGMKISTKTFCKCDPQMLLNKWISKYKYVKDNSIGYMDGINANDFQNQNKVYIVRDIGYMDGINANDFQHNDMVYLVRYKELIINPRGIYIIPENFKFVCIYYAIRVVIPRTWLNNTDQFLYPDPNWETDTQFQTDCIVYTLFSNKNNISVRHGINHWIPFTEKEVNAKDKFASHFMTDYMQGKITVNPEEKKALVEKNQKSSIPTAPLSFSPAAQAVFDAGRELWKYYQSKPDADPNAALYDIKAHFQGRNDKGRMNAKSNDEEYNRLIGILREKLKILADQIAPKVYEHGFLKK